MSPAPTRQSQQLSRRKTKVGFRPLDASFMPGAKDGVSKVTWELRFTIQLSHNAPLQIETSPRTSQSVQRVTDRPSQRGPSVECAVLSLAVCACVAVRGKVNFRRRRTCLFVAITWSCMAWRKARLLTRLMSLARFI